MKRGRKTKHKPGANDSHMSCESKQNNENTMFSPFPAEIHLPPRSCSLSQQPCLDSSRLNSGVHHAPHFRKDFPEAPPMVPQCSLCLLQSRQDIQLAPAWIHKLGVTIEATLIVWCHTIQLLFILNTIPSQSSSYREL